MQIKSSDIKWNTPAPTGNVVNVKFFGAVGDGVTDDTAAIQAGIDSLSNGGTLYFPVGDYRITSTLIISNMFAVKLLGSGDVDQQVVWFGTMIISEVVGNAMEIFDSKRITISDIGFRSDNTSSENNTVIPSDHNGLYIYSDNNPSTQGVVLERLSFAFFSKGIAIGDSLKVSPYTQYQSDWITINNVKTLFCTHGIHTNSSNVTELLINTFRAFVFDAAIYCEEVGPMTIINSDCAVSLTVATAEGAEHLPPPTPACDSFIYLCTTHGSGSFNVIGCQAESVANFLVVNRAAGGAPLNLIGNSITSDVILGSAGISNIDRVNMTGNDVRGDLTLAGDNVQVNAMGNHFNNMNLTLSGQDSRFRDVGNYFATGVGHSVAKTTPGAGAQIIYNEESLSPTTYRTVDDSPYPALDTDEFILANATGGNTTITLPAASSHISGKSYTVKKMDATANTVIVSSNNIQGSPTYTLTVPYQFVTVVCDPVTGSWWITSAS